MSEFIFVRHCQSETNLTPHIVGGCNASAPVSQLGIQQSQQLGKFFKSINLQPDSVYSSGAVRADTTAQLALASANIKCETHIDERLLELSQGIYEGHHRKNVYTAENIEKYNLNSLDGKFPEGESLSDAAERMWKFVETTHVQQPDSTILVFSHGLAIRALTGKILNQTKQELLNIDTPNVSLTKITVENKTPLVHYIGKNVISE